jgi:hypothetical protein
MSVKNMFEQSWEDLKNLELNFKNVSILAIVTIILSSIFTPVVGVPVGLLGSAYWIQNKKKKITFLS